MKTEFYNIIPESWEWNTPWIEVKSSSIKWGDGRFRLHDLFRTAMHTDILCDEVSEAFRIWEPLLSSKAEISHGGVHGHGVNLTEGCIEFLLNIIEFRFSQSLKRIASNCNPRKTDWDSISKYIEILSKKTEASSVKERHRSVVLFGKRNNIRVLNIGNRYVVTWANRHGEISQEIFKAPGKKMREAFLRRGRIIMESEITQLNKFVKMHPPISNTAKIPRITAN